MLLNQAVVAGIANVYADECLHHARIHPSRPASDLSQREIRRLHAAIQTVLRGAIATGGTSFAGYINHFRGWAGYLDHAEVFRRPGQPCPVCGTTIIRTKAAAPGPASARTASRRNRAGATGSAARLPAGSRPLPR